MGREAQVMVLFMQSPLLLKIVMTCNQCAVCQTLELLVFNLYQIPKNFKTLALICVSWHSQQGIPSEYAHTHLIKNK